MPKTSLNWSNSIASSTKVGLWSSLVRSAQIMQFTFLSDENIKFPTHYPTSSLLGCVNVESCLPQEEYRELYPEGESDSPYVFVCSKPEQLPVLLPVQGQPKICKYFKEHTLATV